jgi:glutathione S-transferase
MPVIVKESMKMALKLLGRVTSINVRKVLWATEEFGIAVEREDWGKPVRDPNVPEFLALNPNAQVPVVIDDGFVLWESNAVLRYLAEKHGGLLPPGLAARAMVDQWLFWQLGELNPVWGYAVNALLRQNPAFSDEARIAESIAKWTRMLSVLDGQLAKSSHVAGDNFSIADIAIALSTHRWFSTPIRGRTSLPAVEDHYRRMQARPAGGRWMTVETP